MIGIPIIFVEDSTGYLGREVVRKRAGGAVRDYRRLTCPYSERRPCDLGCALLAGARDEGGRVLFVCRGAHGGDKIIGMPDPERTDLDELAALFAATDAAE